MTNIYLERLTELRSGASRGCPDCVERLRKDGIELGELAELSGASEAEVAELVPGYGAPVLA